MNRLLRRTLWAGAALSAAVAALPAVQASATDLVPAKPPAVAGAAANAPGLAKRHKTEYPTVAGAHAKRLRHAAAGAAATGGNLAYGGAMDGIGVTTGPPKVYLVFWGSQWGTATTTAGLTTFSNDPKGVAPQVEKMLAGREYFFEHFTAVDTYFFWCFRRATEFGLDLSPFANCQAHFARMHTRPSVQKLLAFEKQVQAEFAA